MGAVAVGIAAIVAASVFNVLALRRSGKTLRLAEQTYERTEQRYQLDRRQAHTTQLRDALIAVSFSVATYNVTNAWYAKLLRDFAHGDVTAGTLQDQDVDRMRPALAEVFRAVKTAEFLTSDPRLRAVLTGIAKQVNAATEVVASHDTSVVGILGAAKKLDKIRNQAGRHAGDLIEVAEEVLAIEAQPPPESNAE